MARTSKILVGARTRVILDGRRLPGALSVNLNVEAKSVATAKVRFYELNENGRLQFNSRKIPSILKFDTFVKDIYRDGNGRMVFDLVASAAGMTKKQIIEAQEVIQRSTKPLTEEAK